VLCVGGVVVFVLSCEGSCVFCGGGWWLAIVLVVVVLRDGCPCIGILVRIINV